MAKPTKQVPTNGQPGLVISYFGNSVAVEAADGQVFQCHLRRNQPLPMVGDHISWQLEKDNTGIVISIDPRKSMLARGDGRGNMKPIAANVDNMLVVMAAPPVFSETLLDCYIIAAEILHINPIIVLNKVDLLDNIQQAAMDEQLQRYRDIPYLAVMTSAVTKQGLTELEALLKDKVSVLVGPSGVGKSSLITTFVGQAIRTTEVTRKGTGKHTTTATRFYHLPAGGGLIDSPGLRDFTLWPVTRAELLKGFKEFQPYLTGCKFRDCRHTAEPGCAVQAAVASGKISPQRFAQYQTLMKATQK
jgi:ribosome biogenesis GTPase